MRTDVQIVEAMAQAFGSCTVNAPNACMSAALAVAKPIIREAALREAAAIFASVNNHDNPMTATDCADAILDLLEKPHEHPNRLRRA